MNITVDHFIAVFRFAPHSSPGQRGDDIHYARERLKELLSELPHTDEAEVILLTSL
jgi:hypothetical protein